MAIPAQQSSLATVPPTPVIKQTSPLVWHIPKYNILIIVGASNAQIGKDEIITSACTTRQTEMMNILHIFPSRTSLNT